MPTGNLPSHAKQIFENVYNSAKGKDGCDEGCAARQAWAVVKRKYKNVGGKWVSKSAALGTVDVEKWTGVEHAPIEKSAAGYRDNVGVAGTQCGDCMFFSSPGSCKVVSGGVAVKGLCNFFDPNIAIGDMSSIYARSEFDMVITKASHDEKTGQRRWAAVASDTDLDNFEDHMSLDLYRDFIIHIDKEDKLPTIFTSEAWDSGLPYLGIAHYMDLEGLGIIGDTAALYIDGNRLKAKGVFRSTPLSLAAFSAIQKDMKEDAPLDQRVRISIAFYDLAHRHGNNFEFVRKSIGDSCPACLAGIGDKVYTKGQLIHLALTRIPVNSRTPIWVEERSMSPTIREDALSIVGDSELVDQLEIKNEEVKRKKKLEMARYGEGEEAAAGAVVIKSDDVSTEQPVERNMEAPSVYHAYGGAKSLKDAEGYLKQQDKMYEIMDAFSMLQGVMENVVMDSEIKDKPAAIKTLIGEFKSRVDDAVKRSLATRAAHLILGTEKDGNPMAEDTTTKVEVTPPVAIPAPAPSALETAFVALRDAVVKASNGETPLEERYKSVQPALNSFAEVIKSTVGGDAGRQVDIAAAVSKAVAEQLQPLVAELRSIASVPAAPTVPAPRSFQPRSVDEQVGQKKSPITAMVRRSVGLRD
jgi:hypothetical protein